jgi:hypothetical protein
MRYTEPKILTTAGAISLIQQMTWTRHSDKCCDIFLDSASPLPAPCTLNAYEADE